MTATADLDLAAPAWHRDPGNPRHITYWDGTRWTVHMRWDGTDWQRCREPHDPPVLLAPPGADPGARAAVVGDVPPMAVAAESPAVSVAPTPARRRRRRPMVLVAVLLLVAAGAGGAYALRHRAAASTAPPRTPSSAPSSATQVLDRSLAAARRQGSAHLVSTESAGGVQVNGTYDVSTHEGRQTISGPTGNATVLSMPGVAYLEADAVFLEGNLGLSPAGAAKAAGSWIEFRPADGPFRQLVSGVTLGSALAEATPTGALHLTPVQILGPNATRVVGISGGLPRDSLSGARGQQILYVEAATPYLPVELDLTGTLGGQSGSSKVVFSAWGETVSVSAPPGAVPASSLGS